METGEPEPYKRDILHMERRKNIKELLFLTVSIFVLSLYLFVFSQVFGDILAAALFSLCALLMSFNFGYRGFGVSALVDVGLIIVQLVSWNRTGIMFYLAVFVFVCINLFASGIIACGVEREKKKRDLLEWLSVTDGLTGVYNHRYFKKRLDEEIALALRIDKPLGLCMMDIDQFKVCNDIMGHPRGDEILVKTAQALEKFTRKSDIVFRYGGDEFAIILPDTDAEEIKKVIERVKAGFKELDVTGSDFEPCFHLTFSLGVSVFPRPAVNKEELVSQADKALYYAKSMGRDRIDYYNDVYKDIERMFGSHELRQDNLKKILLAVSGKDQYTLGHSQRVANYSMLMGKEMKMSEYDIKCLRLSALLHDIGKIEIPSEILNKKGKLTEEEFRLMKKHPEQSADIVKSLSGMENIVEDILCHHERYDGTGYPAGISREQIPLGARIIAIADAFDAMLTDRPYKKALSLEEARRELLENSGTQFDPALVKIFVDQFNELEAG